MEEPPEEKNGRGIPVAGKSPETTAMLSTAWRKTTVVRPNAR